MRQHAVEGARHPGEVERLDEQARVADLAAAAAAHETAKLLVARPSLPRRLFLEGAEGAEVALLLDDLLDRGGSECPDQLVLQVNDADVEAERLHPGP